MNGNTRTCTGRPNVSDKTVCVCVCFLPMFFFIMQIHSFCLLLVVFNAYSFLSLWRELTDRPSSDLFESRRHVYDHIFTNCIIRRSYTQKNRMKKITKSRNDSDNGYEGGEGEGGKWSRWTATQWCQNAASTLETKCVSSAASSRKNNKKKIGIHLILGTRAREWNAAALERKFYFIRGIREFHWNLKRNFSYSFSAHCANRVCVCARQTSDSTGA